MHDMKVAQQVGEGRKDSVPTDYGEHRTLRYDWSRIKEWTASCTEGNQAFDDGVIVDADVPFLLRAFDLDKVYGRTVPSADDLRDKSPEDLHAIRAQWEIAQSLVTVN